MRAGPLVLLVPSWEVCDLVIICVLSGWEGPFQGSLAPDPEASVAGELLAAGRSENLRRWGWGRGR